ncbi:MAG TPA: hypothetical protein DHU55_12270 [Blastocatellia bacterium]|nr:hypothetical protein [Blastocatellia bacterium]
MSLMQTFSPAASTDELIDSPKLQSVFRLIDSHLGEITEEQIRICSIPAPPFGEKQRAEYLSSINAIPRDATVDVDLRSASSEELLKLDAFFRRAMREATEEENAGVRDGDRPLELNVSLIGERPNGETPAASPLVKAGVRSNRSTGLKATTRSSVY